MSRFVGDPDYALRWPHDIFSEELSRLIRGAERGENDPGWHDEVQLLLTQAFSSQVPADDFRALLPTAVAYDDFGDEPF